MRRALRLLALAPFLVACGALPRPFEHQGPNPLVEERPAAVPVAIEAPLGLEGLGEALALALADEDIAASVSPARPGTYTLILARDPGAESETLWRLTSPDGAGLGQGTASSNEIHQQRLSAQRLAASVARTIRGETATLGEDAPRVAVRPLAVPAPIDGAGLAAALGRALAAHGLVVAEDGYAAIVTGRMVLRPGPDGTSSALVTWRILDAGGQEVATISQAGTVPALYASGNMGPVGREMAGAGAEAIAKIAKSIGAASTAGRDKPAEPVRIP